MITISDVHAKPLQDASPYIKPFTLHYKQNGVDRTWDLMKVHDSVAVLIHNTSRNVVVLVRQFRPAVYYNRVSSSDALCVNPAQLVLNRPLDVSDHPVERGLTLELCAGCVDKPDKTLRQTASEEVLEECGYHVHPDRLEEIKSFVCGVGTSGGCSTVFYVSVEDQDKRGQGGGNSEEGESIEVVEMTVDQLKDYVNQEDVTSPPGFLFAVYWFFMHKLKRAL